MDGCLNKSQNCALVASGCHGIDSIILYLLLPSLINALLLVQDVRFDCILVPVKGWELVLVCKRVFCRSFSLSIAIINLS